MLFPIHINEIVYYFVLLVHVGSTLSLCGDTAINICHAPCRNDPTGIYKYFQL